VLCQSWFDLAKQISLTVQRDRVHVSLVIRKNKLISVGTNNWKTHPKTVELGYMLPYLHSELDAVRKINTSLDKLTLINYRFSKTGHIGMSRPCKYCMPWCVNMFDKIYYTNEEGILVEL
jgi:hypothetical protein